MYDVDQLIKTATKSSKVTNKLMKFWATFAKQSEVPIDVSKEYWMSIDDIHEKTVFTSVDLVTELFQTNINEDDINISLDTYKREQYLRVSLEDLLTTEDAELFYGLRQFNVIPSRVATLIGGIIDDGRLHLPIEVGYARGEEDNLVVVSGRHRLFALASILSVIDGWKTIDVCVRVIRFNTTIDLVNYIQAANGSRSMSTSERTMLWYTEQGLDANDTSTMFDPCSKALANFRKACSLYFTNELEGHDDVQLKPATLGAIGSSFAVKFKEHLNTLTRPLLKDPEIAKEIAETALSTFIDNYHTFSDMVKVTEKETGKVSYNFARKYSVIAAELAKVIYNAFEEQLNECVSEKAAAKEAKAIEAAKAKEVRQQKAADSKRRQVEDVMNLLRSKGVSVDNVDIEELVTV